MQLDDQVWLSNSPSFVQAALHSSFFQTVALPPFPSLLSCTYTSFSYNNRNHHRGTALFFLAPSTSSPLPLPSHQPLSPLYTVHAQPFLPSVYLCRLMPASSTVAPAATTSHHHYHGTQSRYFCVLLYRSDRYCLLSLPPRP